MKATLYTLLSLIYIAAVAAAIPPYASLNYGDIYLDGQKIEGQVKAEILICSNWTFSDISPLGATQKGIKDTDENCDFYSLESNLCNQGEKCLNYDARTLIKEKILFEHDGRTYLSGIVVRKGSGLMRLEAQLNRDGTASVYWASRHNSGPGTVVDETNFTSKYGEEKLWNKILLLTAIIVAAAVAVVTIIAIAVKRNKKDQKGKNRKK